MHFFKSSVGSADRPVAACTAALRVDPRASRWVLAGALLLSLAGGANAQKIGDWRVENGRGVHVAVTENSSKSALGYTCNRKSRECVFFYVPDGLKCTEGGKYALLINSGKESTSRVGTCRNIDWSPTQKFANVLDGTEAFRKQMLNADNSTIGIARGTGTDGFGVSKFSMKGFRAAYDSVTKEGSALRDSKL